MVYWELIILCIHVAQFVCWFYAALGAPGRHRGLKPIKEIYNMICCVKWPASLVNVESRGVDRVKPLFRSQQEKILFIFFCIYSPKLLMK